MMASIQINGTTVPVLEYGAQRVVTLTMIDQVHQRPEGTAGRNFREHRDRLIEGEDYFGLTQADEIRRLGIARPQGGFPAQVYLLTESGYLMLVKSFTDDLAWDVQRKLVRSYFTKAAAETKPSAILPSKEFRALFGIARMIGCDKPAAAISANQAVVKLTGTNLLALIWHTHIEAENQDALYFTPTELGARIDISALKLNQRLANAGLQVRHGKTWEPTPAGKEFSRVYDTGKKHNCGTPIQQVKWSASVMGRIAA